MATSNNLDTCECPRCYGPAVFIFETLEIRCPRCMALPNPFSMISGDALYEHYAPLIGPNDDRSRDDASA